MQEITNLNLETLEESNPTVSRQPITSGQYDQFFLDRKRYASHELGKSEKFEAEIVVRQDSKPYLHTIFTDGWNQKFENEREVSSEQMARFQQRG